MFAPKGGFYSTQDADSEGEDGKFFVWTPDEIREVLGDEVEAFMAADVVTSGGNASTDSAHGFEGKNILEFVGGLDQRPALVEAHRKLFEAQAAAYVCGDFVCQAPVTDLEAPPILLLRRGNDLDRTQVVRHLIGRICDARKEERTLEEDDSYLLSHASGCIHPAVKVPPERRVGSRGPGTQVLNCLAFLQRVDGHGIGDVCRLVPDI
jgi:hypothetical protein